MTCYIVPMAAWLLVRNNSGKYNKWLNHLLLGGSAFGIIDHAWNKELFLFGPKWYLDIALGFAITAGIFAVWGIMIWQDKKSLNVTKDL